MFISAIIPHWPSSRGSDLRKAIRALRKGGLPPGEIIVWDNTGELADIEGVRVLRSPGNLGAFGRFIAAGFAHGDVVFFQDNDLAVGPLVLKMLSEWHLRVSDAVLSIHGLQVEESYKQRRIVHAAPRGALNQVNVVLGRGDLVPIKWVRAAMATFSGTIPRMDDLWFSERMKVMNVPMYVAPIPAPVLYNLPSHVTGACSEPDHYSEREKVFRALFQKEGVA